ncbi:hypothetical protein [Actinoallomurus sp. NPDC050550]|uniref:hypothetical protein n=1 Tax=Actinoallomurus sp. NPDC050550 TaxID=3154937 RepID=UPI0033EA4432
MFEQICANLANAALAGDQQAFGPLLPAVQEQAAGLPADRLTAGVRAMAGAIAEASPHLGGWVAVLTGALVENGADAGPAGPAVVDRLVEVAAAALAFAGAWEKATGGAPPDPMEHQPSQEVWETVHPELGDGAGITMESWWALPQFAMAASTMLARDQAVRASVTERDFKISVVEQAAPHLGQLEYVRDLLKVLDGERLLVLDRATGRGWTVVIGGVGDNFQLHTLLAHALVRPGGMPGEAPDPRWVASSIDQDVEPGTPPVAGVWNLVDAHGSWIWNEGVPADIPEVGGTRIVVLDPPTYPRTWSPGRRFPLMPGSLTVEGAHAPEELRDWWQHVKPAVPPAGG